MHINIKLLTPTAKIPQKMSTNAAGYDIFANLTDDVTLNPLQRVLIPTGFAMALPENNEAQIRTRSGLAINEGLVVLNSPGTIDSDYRGEIKVILINLSDKQIVIKNEMRIAQMVISKHENPEFVTVNDLNSTLRGEKGFGSSN